MSEMENLLIGSVGWEHEAWLDSYYPEDLPEDWRLDFYSNQFYTVLLPLSKVIELSEDAVEEVVDALVDEDFSIFVLKDICCEADSTRQRLLELIPFVKGLVFHASESDRAWLSLCDGLGLTKTFFGSKEDYLASSEDKSHWSWLNETEGKMFWGEPLAWVQEVPTSQNGRIELLNQFVSSLPERQNGAPLFFGNQQQDYFVNAKALLDLKLVAEFLGH